LRRVVRTRATGGRVARVWIDKAVRLAPDRETGGVERTLQIGGAVRTEVDLTAWHTTAHIVVNSGWEIVTIDQADVVIVVAVCGRQTPFCQGGRRDTSSGVWVAHKAPIASPIQARVRAWV